MRMLCGSNLSRTIGRCKVGRVGLKIDRIAKQRVNCSAIFPTNYLVVLVQIIYQCAIGDSRELDQTYHKVRAG